MNRTITINISGIVFHIDDNAYEKLKDYLSKVDSIFSNQERGREIIFNIESRIAELLNERISAEQNVVDEKMIDEIISIMGLPKDFSEEEFQQQPDKELEAPIKNNYYKRSRRLYRDTDSRVFGGVCSGLAHYFNSDKVLMRVIFVVLFIITSGVALPAYLILWIAVPKAQSSSRYTHSPFWYE